MIQVPSGFEQGPVDRFFFFKAFTFEGLIDVPNDF